ncbi:MAG: class E sortase [Micrococcales bacterium]|nr:class E sortase [Micrococcales bacterium]
MTTNLWPDVVRSEPRRSVHTSDTRYARHANPAWSVEQAAYSALGVVGEMFITVGVGLLAFLVWQLWWTDIEANHAQSQILRDLYADAPVPAPGPAVPGQGPPPVIDEPGKAVTFASFEAPRWRGEPARPISQGTDPASVLNPLGIGHYDHTAMPGDIGNFAIAGHRTTYGKPFNRVEELKVGDALVIWTPQTWYVYTVTSTRIVSPKDGYVTNPVPDRSGADPTKRLITMTTCHPMFSAQQRYVVHGEFAYWAPTSSGTPQELLNVKG